MMNARLERPVMDCLRRNARGLAYSLLLLTLPLAAQQPAAPPPPSAPKPNNPFETVPQAAPETPDRQEAPRLETPTSAAEPAQPSAEGTNAFEDVVESIEFRGVRRVPQDTLRAMIFTKRGDKFDEESVRRDFMALWNTGRFDDIRVERERGRTGWILRFVMTERRVIRSIKYSGNH